MEVDQPRAVRKGEELDAAALEAYLRDHLPLGEGALAVEQFGSGYSNLTYLLRIGGRELVLRRPPAGANVRGGHDMGREHRILKGLEGVYAKAPAALLYCEDAAVLGAPFYVMERVRGVILRGPSAVGGAPAPDTMRRISEALIDTLAELHGVDYTAAGLGGLGKPEGYAGRQVAGWRQRYAQAATDDVGAMDAVGEWLAAHLPAQLPAEPGAQGFRPAGAALIHNDFKLDNVVLDPDDLTRVTAVLDWEMATIGDPLLDLGVTLAYWIQEGDPPVLQRIGLGRLPGSLRRGEAAARYAEARGVDPAAFGDQIVFAYVLGLFKVAVIAQQIYYRYRQGFTRDGRFAGLDAVVAACAEMAVQAVASGRIEPEL